MLALHCNPLSISYPVPKSSILSLAVGVLIYHEQVVCQEGFTLYTGKVLPF